MNFLCPFGLFVVFRGYFFYLYPRPFKVNELCEHSSERTRSIAPSSLIQFKAVNTPPGVIVKMIVKL